MKTNGTQLRVVIVDDEPLARDLLKRHIAKRSDLRCVGEAASGKAAAALIQSKSPDIVLLDIQMPGGDGFEALDTLDRQDVKLPLVVFVTAFDRYAVRAFEMNAVDYLLKPVTQERFDEAIDRCRTRSWRSVADVGGLLEDTLRRTPRRLLVRTQRKIVPVPVQSIGWVQAAGDYVTIHVEGQQHLVERTLKSMERLLAPRGFTRIHRSILVNLKRIRELESLGSSRYEVVLVDGTRLPVSRSYSTSLKEQFL